jgi:hypothetical protein
MSKKAKKSKPKRKSKPDVRQRALAAVERAIGGTLASRGQFRNPTAP